MFRLSRSRPAPSPHPAPAPATTAAPDADDGAAIAALITLLEQDLSRARGRVTAAGDAAARTAVDSRAIVADIHGLTDSLAARTEEAEGNSNRIVAASADLARQNDLIAARTRTSGDMLGEAQVLAGGASHEMANLLTAISEIEEVVGLIAQIAAQTNLLALNATIEAARAGAAGRGFAVVAGEVKALSVETRQATDRISATIAGLRSTSGRAVDAVGRIVGVVADIQPVFAGVTAAVAGQSDATADIGATAAAGSRFAAGGADRTRAIRAAATSAVAVSERAEQATAEMGRTILGVTRQLVTVLRQTEAGDRRRHDRWPVEIAGRLSVAGRTLPVATIDLGAGGALVAAGDASTGMANAGAACDLTLDGIGTLPGRLAASSALGLHVAFRLEGAESARTALDRRIADLAAAARHEIELAQRSAAAIGAALDNAIAQRRLTLAALFDLTYAPVPGTDPQQLTTPSLAALEDILPAIQEPILTADRSITFCVAVDLNGYLPVHNAQFSQVQRPGDPVWNAAHSRNRRIFDDRTGLLAARNTRPFLIQNYPRDLGGGRIVQMREIDVPIHVGGRHWGGLRTARRL